VKAFQLHLGDCLEVMRTLPDCSVDAVVTDPPYGLSFMGKKWDYDVPSVEVWAECLRVLKPGGHLLAFAGTKTQHRMACRIEDAGFEIRDMIAWVYGSGFPKSLDVSKAIDKAAGVEREVVGDGPYAARRPRPTAETNIEGAEYGFGAGHPITAPAPDAARQWSGWGTALKPAMEPITMARKPLSGTVAETVLQHGTGAINVDGCRVGTEAVTINTWNDGAKPFGGGAGHEYTGRTVQGRWPANIIHDGSNEAALALKSGARFFYSSKTGKDDRETDNNHPTVKPTMLMAYLCRLVTPQGGTVLDPFMGSGSTGKAATVNGFRFIGIERDPEYHKIAEARISDQTQGMLL
jgi:site-specific DNA-methyltransferase (adenine-specific)